MRFRPRDLNADLGLELGRFETSNRHHCRVHYVVMRIV